VAAVISFLTRSKGSADGVHKYGAQDIVAYGYLLLGILIILIPVMWTVISSFKTDEAIESFDTRLIPYDQIEQEIDGVGNKPMYIWHDQDGNEQLVFKAGRTRSITKTISIHYCSATDRNILILNCYCGILFLLLS